MFTNKISVLEIVEDTTVDGSGFRTSIYAAGCEHGCKGCHNPESWDISNGKWMDIDEILKLSTVIFLLKFLFLRRPNFQPKLLRISSKNKARNPKNIWCYTGLRFKKILRNHKLSAILPYIDVCRWTIYREKESWQSAICWSSNQRIINVKESLKANKMVEWKILFFFEE